MIGLELVSNGKRLFVASFSEADAWLGRQCAGLDKHSDV
jgi:hypothetical protein